MHNIIYNLLCICIIINEQQLIVSNHQNDTRSTHRCMPYHRCSSDFIGQMMLKPAAVSCRWQALSTRVESDGAVSGKVNTGGGSMMKPTRHHQQEASLIKLARLTSERGSETFECRLLHAHRASISRLIGERLLVICSGCCFSHGERAGWRNYFHRKNVGLSDTSGSKKNRFP